MGGVSSLLHSVLRFLDLTLDTRTHEGKRGERPFTLSSKEYALLQLLMSRPREILSRTTIQAKPSSAF